MGFMGVEREEDHRYRFSIMLVKILESGWVGLVLLVLLDTLVLLFASVFGGLGRAEKIEIISPMFLTRYHEELQAEREGNKLPAGQIAGQMTAWQMRLSS